MKQQALAVTRDGFKVLGGAWLTGVVMTTLMTWQWNQTAADPAPVGWVAAIAAVVAVPASLLVLALYALFRMRLQRACRPWHAIGALAASMLLFRATGDMYTQGGAGGSTFILWVMAAHWLLLYLACLGVLHVALKRSGHAA
jgi:hypothetical protein